MEQRRIPVSVIVPVYNTESYLASCIESIRRQTFRDFELLLIDDGSTDLSGRICQKAAASDARIRYYYKENSGPSESRNFGVARARGEYLTFVDSDDYVEDTYLETLLDLCLTWASPVSCVDIFVDGEHQKQARTGAGECISSVEALRRCCIRDGFGVSICGKMYHISLAGDLQLPVGHFYEDLMTIPYLFEKCHKAACCRDRLYHYRFRSNSTTRRRLNDKDIQLVGHLLDLVKYVDEYAPEIHDAAVCRLVVDVFHMIIYRLVFEDNYLLVARRIIESCGRVLKESWRNPYLTPGKKLQSALFLRLPGIYKHMHLYYSYFR